MAGWLTSHHDPDNGRMTHHDPDYGRMTHYDPDYCRMTHHDPDNGRMTHHEPYYSRMTHHDPDSDRLTHWLPLGMWLSWWAAWEEEYRLIALLAGWQHKWSGEFPPLPGDRQTAGPQLGFQEGKGRDTETEKECKRKRYTDIQTKTELKARYRRSGTIWCCFIQDLSAVSPKFGMYRGLEGKLAIQRSGIRRRSSEYQELHLALAGFFNRPSAVVFN